MQKDPEINVLGAALAACSQDPVTGFFRDGHCNTCEADQGSHTVCAVMTAEFLAYSKYFGNDLSTPRPEYGFVGLKPGDHWCLCAGRFLQAHEEGCAPKQCHWNKVYANPLDAHIPHALANPQNIVFGRCDPRCLIGLVSRDQGIERPSQLCWPAK